jgi:hypothetical protein
MRALLTNSYSEFTEIEIVFRRLVMNKVVGLVCGALLMSGCNNTPTGKHSVVKGNEAKSATSVAAVSQGGLFPHLEESVIQPVIEGMANHPRLHNRPFKIVAMNDGNISSTIDDLSREVRSQLADGLRHSNAVTGKLLLQSVRRWEHHRSFSDLKCGENETPSFYLGLDIRSYRDQLKVSVNALDPEEQSWISGFGTRWQGGASKQDMEELTQVREDASLKGLRPLPFNESEKDLMASYLSTNLSCLLSSAAVEADGDIVLFVESVKGDDANFISSLFQLVDNYISGLNEIKITEQRDQANVILSREAHHITGDLYQVWVKVHENGRSVRVGGVDTNAYVQLKKKDT